MKTLNHVAFILGTALLVACAPSAEEKGAMEKARGNHTGRGTAP